VHAHRPDHARRLARYEAMQRAADGAPADRDDPYALATLHFGIAYERAALAWFDQLPAAIRGPGAWARPE
jgi:hypothetical protein